MINDHETRKMRFNKPKGHSHVSVMIVRNEMFRFLYRLRSHKLFEAMCDANSTRRSKKSVLTVGCNS